MPRRALVPIIVAVAVTVSSIAGFNTAASAQSVSDVEARDQLIANQENLLNAYRCLYSTDIDVVPGGCGNPVQVTPGPAPSSPSLQDLQVRDQLIADQEALLNVYRCQFDVDTELVPEGCSDQETEEMTDDNVIPWRTEFIANWELMTHLGATCAFNNVIPGERIAIGPRLRSSKIEITCSDPSDIDSVNRIATQLYGCTIPELFGLDGMTNDLHCQTGPETTWGIPSADFAAWAGPPEHHFTWTTQAACPPGNRPELSGHGEYEDWDSDRNLQLCYRHDHPNHHDYARLASQNPS